MEREKWAAWFWLGVGILICIGSLRLSVGSFRSPGPGLVPFICGAILGILSLIVHLQARWSRPPKELEKPFWKNKKRVWKVFLTFIALLGYAIGMEYLGFLVSTTILISFLLWAIEPQRWYVVIFGSLLTSLAAYTIFELLLSLPLPRGFLEF
jgi:putative tricarboxylic transport membrane protein